MASRDLETGSKEDYESLHEKLTTLPSRPSSSSSLSISSTKSTPPPPTPTTSRRSRSASTRRSHGFSRTVSEVRDGISNQRELNDDDDDQVEVQQEEEEIEEPRRGEKAGRRRQSPSQTGDREGGHGDEEEERGRDENLVTWDGPDDAANPKNWPNKKKWAAVITVSLFTLISPVSSTMAAPALPQIGSSLDIASPSTELALTLSIFVLGYSIGPLFWGPMSELHGRMPILQLSNLWFFCFNLGCALARTKGQMIALRFLAGIGGSAPMSVSGGVLADLFTPEERGRAISISSAAPLLGPAIGPICGGWIAERTTWRWVFYSTTIACGFVQVNALFFLQETYAPVLLTRKKNQLIKATSNRNLHTEHDNPSRTHLQVLLTALTRPFRLLFTQPILVFLAAYMAYLYGTMYLVLTTFPRLFSEVYHQSPGIQGLNYVSIGLGFFLGTQVCAPLQDRIYAALKRRRCQPGQPGLPEFRVPMMVPGAVLVPAGLLIYAWTSELRTHWLGPNIGACIYAAGLIVGYQCIQGYLVDTYARYAASAVGAAAVLRSLAGFGFPLFADAMYDRLGYGWGGTLMAGLAVVLGWPGPVVLWLYGPKMRAKSKFARG